MSNNSTLSECERKIDHLSSDIADWRITFVETGLHANLRERLVAVRAHVGDDEVFLAYYSDGLSDVLLDAMIEDFHAKHAVASFIAVRTWQSFHSVQLAKDDY